MSTQSKPKLPVPFSQKAPTSEISPDIAPLLAPDISINLSTEPQSPPPSSMSWELLGLTNPLLELVQKTGYKSPTAVQEKSIPQVLAGKDLIVSSQTGSGKTASFVLPIIEKFKGTEGTFGLILAPTREIAQQTQAVLETFGTPLGIRSIVLIGGIDMKLDDKALQTYPQVIVATPGRLCDHLNRGNIWLEFIKVFVLDEADQMIDMGFSQQLGRIIEDLPPSRQTLVFSATFTSLVERLVKKIMKDPLRITAGKTSSAPAKIEQNFIWTNEEAKLSKIISLLQSETGTIIIFTRSKERASRLWRSLHSRQVYDATFIHSDCSQAHREKALEDFKTGQFRVLVATDIAGRGIDVDNVAHVINYDLPLHPEDYIHRIGRTGRQGKTGKATSLIQQRDLEFLRKVEKLLGYPLNLK